MRSLSILFTACAVLTLMARYSGMAQPAEKTLVGYLVDKGCAAAIMKSPKEKIESKAQRHTRECNIDEACSAEGYGLIVGDTLYLLDDAGNHLALTYCKSIHQKDNILVTVTGTVRGEILTVESIKKKIAASKKYKG